MSSAQLEKILKDPTSAPYVCKVCNKPIHKGDVIYKGTTFELCEKCCRGIMPEDLTIA